MWNIVYMCAFVGSPGSFVASSIQGGKMEDVVLGNRVKPRGPMGTQLIPRSGIAGKNNDDLFRIVMPMEVGNYIFIKPADSLHQVRRSPSTLKKTSAGFKSCREGPGGNGVY